MGSGSEQSVAGTALTKRICACGANGRCVSVIGNEIAGRIRHYVLAAVARLMTSRSDGWLVILLIDRGDSVAW